MTNCYSLKSFFGDFGVHVNLLHCSLRCIVVCTSKLPLISGDLLLIMACLHIWSSATRFFRHNVNSLGELKWEELVCKLVYFYMVQEIWCTTLPMVSLNSNNMISNVMINTKTLSFFKTTYINNSEFNAGVGWQLEKHVKFQRSYSTICSIYAMS